MTPGTLVRPIVSLAGLDNRRQYTVREFIGTPFASIVYLVDAVTGAQLPPVENGHLILEPVKPGAALIRPATALFN